MKKLIATILILALLLPAAALAEAAYTPALGMTISEFIAKYNAVQAPIGSPYIVLDNPVKWTVWKNYNVAWYYPCSDQSTTILILSADTAAGKNTSAGLDMIQIFSGKNWPQLLSVATRCASMFSSDLLSLNLAQYSVTDVVKNSFENGWLEKGYTSYKSLDFEEQYAITYFRSGGDEYFQISTLEAAK